MIEIQIVFLKMKQLALFGRRPIKKFMIINNYLCTLLIYKSIITKVGIKLRQSTKLHVKNILFITATHC